MMVQVEIWSDVMCPFCYIGKRRFEEAMAEFEHPGEVEITWKSFQLNPNMQTDPSINIHQYLADAKGWNLDYAKQMNDGVTEMAESVGLQYDFDRAVVANSFKAHRFSHLATKHGLGDAAEEALFKAYFSQGRNIDDNKTLLDLAAEIGLDAIEAQQMLNTTTFSAEVNEDIAEARELGISGVPFYVFNRKYAVSGAQPPQLFLQTLRKAFEDQDF